MCNTILCPSFLLMSTHTHVHACMCTVSEKQRMQAYKKEMAQLSEMATTLMENMSDKPSTFTSATHVEHIRAMFKVNHQQLGGRV